MKTSTLENSPPQQIMSKELNKQMNLKRVYIKDFTLPNGSVYTGQLLDGKFDGWGILRYPNNERYEGNFVKGKKHGLGKYYYQSGEYYIGGWSNNQKSGQGIYFYDNNKRYEGQFQNNLKHGQGTIYETNGNTYKGKFAQNHKHGSGQYYDAVDNKKIKFIFNKGEEVSSTQVPQTTVFKSKDQNQLPPVPNYQQFAEVTPDGIASMILQNYSNLYALQNEKERAQMINSDDNGFISLNFSNDTPSNQQITFKKCEGEGTGPLIHESIELKNETLRQIRIDEWTADNVCQWLEEIQFGDVVAEFRFQNITGFSLLRLKDEDLKQLGIPYQQDRVVLSREIDFLGLFFKTQCVNDQICKFKGAQLDYDLILKLEKLEGRVLKKHQSQILYEEQFRKNEQQNQMNISLKKQTSAIIKRNDSNNQKDSENSDADQDTQSSSSSQSSNESTKQRKNSEERQRSRGKNSGKRKKLHIQRKIQLQMRKKRIDTKIFIESSQIEIDRAIGKGTYGEVFLATLVGQQVAVKRYVKKNGFRNRHIARFLEQTEITNKLLHPNIVLYMGMFIIDNDYAIVMEYLAGGSLFDYLHIKGYKLAQSKILKICKNIAIGMVYLHGKNIIHCDLKSSNLLLDENWKVKISDFGLSQIKKPGSTSKKQRSTRLGSPQWMAPQVMRGERYEFACDVYSFGMVLWQLLTCEIPYRELTEKEVLEKVGKSEDLPIRIPSHHNSHLVELFLMCTQRQAKKRPTFNQIVKQLQKYQKPDHIKPFQHRKNHQK